MGPLHQCDLCERSQDLFKSTWMEQYAIPKVPTESFSLPSCPCADAEHPATCKRSQHWGHAAKLQCYSAGALPSIMRCASEQARRHCSRCRHQPAGHMSTKRSSFVTLDTTNQLRAWQSGQPAIKLLDDRRKVYIHIA
jgi:hypothetical protein